MRKMLIMLVLFALLLTACEQKSASSEADKQSSDAQNEQQTDKDEQQKNDDEKNDEAAKGEVNGEQGEENMKFTQLDAAKAGEELAVFHTTMGDIKFRLFPEAAPKAVENFKKHIKDGYYNGIIFHRVIEDFMIQGGDPTGTGRGGESIWGEAFEDEFHPYYRNIRGALSMANAGPNTNGSQFFIVHDPIVDESVISQMKKAGEVNYPKEVVEAYKTYGGAFWLDGKHTVFGQVCEGFDVVDAIAKVKTDDADKPLTDVVIESAEIIVVE